MLINVLEYAVQKFTAIFSVFFFLTEFLRRLGWPHLSRSRLNFLPYSVRQKSTIIVD